MPDIADLVQDDPARGIFRVHRSTMTSTEIQQLEWQRIFDRCWLFVGHDSEIPNPGDYRRRRVAGQPLVFVRGSDNAIRVLFNTCSHRGALVCRMDAGNATTFQCFYHAWTFDNQGTLVGVPDADSYGPAFDRAERALQAPARVESYRGMYFVSFDPAAQDLASYLGEVRSLLDLTLDSAEVLGGWTVMAGTTKARVRANWKLLVENSIDNYHFPTVHQTYQEYLTKRGAIVLAPGQRREGRRFSRGFTAPHGHGGMLQTTTGKPIANPSPLWTDEAKQETARIRGLLEERFGAERAEAMAEGSRHMLIFPNFLVQDAGTGVRFRQIWPLSPDTMEFIQWELTPRLERADLHAYRMEGSLAFLGPGGFATPDDIEAIESCQQGYSARRVEWSDLSRGMLRENPTSEDELQTRGFWRQWCALMQGQESLEWTGDGRAPAPDVIAEA